MSVSGSYLNNLNFPMLNKIPSDIFLIISILCFSCGQTKGGRLLLGKAHAATELKIALSDTSVHNVINKSRILLKEENVAINIAEAILFSTYGKSNIIRQRPYETYQIDKYWIISGTLPKESVGELL